MLIPSLSTAWEKRTTSLSRRVNANSQLSDADHEVRPKLIKKGEC